MIPWMVAGIEDKSMLAVVPTQHVSFQDWPCKVSIWVWRFEVAPSRVSNSAVVIPLIAPEKVRLAKVELMVCVASVKDFQNSWVYIGSLLLTFTFTSRLLHTTLFTHLLTTTPVSSSLGVTTKATTFRITYSAVPTTLCITHCSKGSFCPDNTTLSVQLHFVIFKCRYRETVMRDYCTV